MRVRHGEKRQANTNFLMKIYNGRKVQHNRNKLSLALTEFNLPKWTGTRVKQEVK